MSAESWGVEPNGLGPGPALSWTVQLRPPASYREKEASSVPCRGLGSRNGRTFLAPLSLLGGVDQPGHGSRGEGALSSKRAGTAALPL